jgi:type II secretory pathway component PulF
MKRGALRAFLFEKDIFESLSSKESTRWRGEYWKCHFMHNLSLHVDAGIDLARAIQFCSRIVPWGLRDSTLEVARAIEEGRSLTDSMRTYIPGMLPEPLFGAIEIGEKSGGLGHALKIIDEELFARMVHRQKAISLLIYPLMVFLTGVGIVTFLLVKVLPTFTEIFHDLGAALPPLTQVLVQLSGFIRKNVLILALLVGAALFGLSFFLAFARRNALLGKILLKIPYFGSIVYHQNNQSFSRLLAVLLKVATPIHEALLLCESDAVWACYRKGIAQARADVSEGKTLSEAIGAQKLFSPTFRWLVAVGEQNGDMVASLGAIGEYEKTCVQNNASMMLNLFEPALLVCCSFVVGFIVVSMWLPILTISELV